RSGLDEPRLIGGVDDDLEVDAVRSGFTGGDLDRELLDRVAGRIIPVLQRPGPVGRATLGERLGAGVASLGLHVEAIAGLAPAHDHQRGSPRDLALAQHQGPLGGEVAHARERASVGFDQRERPLELAQILDTRDRHAQARAAGGLAILATARAAGDQRAAAVELPTNPIERSVTAAAGRSKHRPRGGEIQHHARRYADPSGREAVLAGDLGKLREVVTIRDLADYEAHAAIIRTRARALGRAAR